MNNIVELMGSFNSECNGGGSSGTNGVESIEDVPEMSDLKQDVETYKQASCATQGACTYLMKVYMKQSIYPGIFRYVNCIYCNPE